MEGTVISFKEAYYEESWEDVNEDSITEDVNEDSISEQDEDVDSSMQEWKNEKITLNRNFAIQDK